MRQGGCGDGFTDVVVGTDDGFEAFEGGVATGGLVSVFDGLGGVSPKVRYLRRRSTR